jgi:coproporphyrinogen III oxidase-like Fe-S oxidoreductase
VRADTVFAAAGLQWYEVSNWARPDQACRHNELYWSGGEYVGIGCAAHGHTDGRRWWNVRTPERYIAAISRNASAIAGSEELDPETRAEEAFSLALRTRAGAVADDRAAAVVSELAGQGLVDREGARIVLTRPGRLLASDLTARLLLAGAASPGPESGPGPGSGHPSSLALGTIEC